MHEWIGKLFENEEFLRMGHCQRKSDLNLGMGWIYYGLTRLIRPGLIIVIGSWRGFTPLIFGKGMIDNRDSGDIYFIDPSFADDFWKNNDKVQSHFREYGITNISHFLMTTQEFVKTETYRSISKVDMVFIDGLHTAEQAKYDFEAFEHLISDNGIFLFHDSMTSNDRVTWLYSARDRYDRTVKDFMSEIRSRADMEILELPFAKGLALARKI